MKLLSALLALAAVPSVASDSCSPEDLNGVYTYMATTGGNGGKAYTVVVNYEPETASEDGLFVIFADAMSTNNGRLIEVVPDDSAFVRFDKTNFKVVDGKCKFGFPADLDLDMANAGKVEADKNLLCPLIKADAPGEDNEPDCGFSVIGTKVSENTWRLDFPPFETGAPRLMTRN